MSDDILQYLNDGEWHSGAQLVEVSGLSARSVAQQMRGLMKRGKVERMGEGPYLYQLANSEFLPVFSDSDTAAVEAVETEPPTSFAIWDDGSMSISREGQALYLSTSDVARLTAHLARFQR